MTPIKPNHLFRVNDRVAYETDNNGPIYHGTVIEIFTHAVRVEFDDGEIRTMYPSSIYHEN